MTTHEQYDSVIKTTRVRSEFIRLFEVQAQLYDSFLYLKNNGTPQQANDAHVKFVAMKHLTEGFKSACEIFLGYGMVEQIMKSVNSELTDSGIVREGD